MILSALFQHQLSVARCSTASSAGTAQLTPGGLKAGPPAWPAALLIRPDCCPAAAASSLTRGLLERPAAGSVLGAALSWAAVPGAGGGEVRAPLLERRPMLPSGSGGTLSPPPPTSRDVHYDPHALPFHGGDGTPEKGDLPATF